MISCVLWLAYISVKMLKHKGMINYALLFTFWMVTTWIPSDLVKQMSWAQGSFKVLRQVNVNKPEPS